MLCSGRRGGSDDRPHPLGRARVRVGRGERGGGGRGGQGERGGRRERPGDTGRGSRHAQRPDQHTGRHGDARSHRAAEEEDRERDRRVS